MRLNHRTRLALVSATATGLVLGVLFAGIVFAARYRTYSDKQAELKAIMKSFTPPGDPAFDIDEFHEAHPELSASVFQAGKTLRRAGRIPPGHVIGDYRIGRQLVHGETFKGQDIAVSMDIKETERGMELLAVTLIVIWFPLTLLIGGVTWSAAQSVFRPLGRLSEQALAMSGTNLSERLVTPDLAEFGAFASNLNRMLDRIEETVRRGERLSADAAHELRTPLALLRTRLETTLLNPRTTEEYETAIRRSVEEVERLTGVTEALLRSSRGETGTAADCELAPIVAEGVQLWRERYLERGVVLESSIGEAKAAILPEEVRILLDNFLDNALRYAPEESQVSLLLTAKSGEVWLTVRDQGAGVPSELGDKIFDRFVRADDSRNRASGGAGIGLAVCRRIVEARGGGMSLVRHEVGVEIGCHLPISEVS